MIRERYRTARFFMLLVLGAVFLRVFVPGAGGRWLLFLGLSAGALLLYCLVTDRGWRLGGRRKRLAFFSHLALAGLILSAVLSALSGYRGVFLLSEGQGLLERREGFLRWEERLLLNRPSGEEIELERFHPQYRWRGRPVGPAAELAAGTGTGQRRGITFVNHPWKFKGRSFYVIRYGYAPVLAVRDMKGEGREVFRSCLSLNNRPGQDSSWEVFPRLARASGTLLDASVRVEYGAVPGDGDAAAVLRLNFLSRGRTVELSLGEEKDVGSLRFAFPELRHWALLQVVREPFYLWVVFFSLVGVLLFALGAVLN